MAPGSLYGADSFSEGGIDPPKKHMARHYLRLGDLKIPVTDEQVRELSKHRWEPEKVLELRSAIFADNLAKAKPRTEEAPAA